MKQYVRADRRLYEIENDCSSPPLLIIYAVTSILKKPNYKEFVIFLQEEASRGIKYLEKNILEI